MYFEALKEHMKAGLGAVRSAIDSKAVLPVLGNVCITLADGRVELGATDLEIRVDCRVGGRVETTGATTVPARLLTDLINSLPNERIDFRLEDAIEELHVHCGKNKATIKCIPAKEFPLRPRFADDELLAQVPADTLREMIRRVLIAASKDRLSRPRLAGVLMRFKDDELTMAAADGFRLSVCSTKIAGNSWEPLDVIVPAWGLAEIPKHADEGDVQIFVTERQAGFRTDRVDLTCQLIEGRFPQYENIVPQKHDLRTVVDVAELAQAVRVARMFAKQELEIVQFSVVKDKPMVVLAETAEAGDVQTEVEAAVFPADDHFPAADNADPDILIAFNGNFFLQALNVMGSDKVVIETTNRHSPALLRPEPEGDVSFCHVIMPMSITTK